VVCFIFMGLEFAGGIISGSLAILTDAAHMFSDVAGFMISFFSIYVSQRPSNFKYTMGYHRYEIIGAFLSIAFIWGLLIWLNIEATDRIINPPPEIDSTVMLVTACIGFGCNIINFCVLEADNKDEVDEESEGDNPTYSFEEKTYGKLGDSLTAVYRPRGLRALSLFRSGKSSNH